MMPELFDELSVFGELHHARIAGLGRVAVGNENVSVECDRYIVRLIKSVWPVAGDIGLAQRHQNFAIGRELEYLMALALPASAVGHPDVAVFVDANAMRKNKHAFAKAFHQLAGCIEFQDRRIGLAGASVGSASFGDPNTFAVAIDLDGA